MTSDTSMHARQFIQMAGRAYLYTMRNWGVLILFIYYGLLPICGQTYSFQEKINVLNGEEAMPFPWAGGLNSPLICGADINHDGTEDLFVFDKIGRQKMVFIHSGIPGSRTYNSHPEYAALFPDVEGWVRLVDYNCDGIMDFFTYNNGGSIRVFKGYYTPEDQLAFLPAFDGLTYPSGGFNINLYNSFVDRAALADVNDDGDLDILSFDVDGTRILYYENQRVEDGLPCDSMRYKIADRCWGNIYESGLATLVEIKDTCAGKFLRLHSPLGAEQTAHVGSSISAADYDGDKDIDVLLGDISFSFINLLYNDGSKSYASVLRQDTLFPASLPLRLNSFPTSELIDANYDGKKDLVFSPFSSSFADNIKNIRLYSGSPSGFIFTQNDFLTGGMIDVGEGAAPVFYDLDGDSKPDILIGNAGERYTPDAGPTVSTDGIRALYNKSGSENTSFSAPGDYILTSLLPGLKELVPESIDLDLDGDKDLLVGESTGRIYWLERTCQGNAISCFTNRGPLKDGSNADIDVGLNAVPALADLNRDTKPDMVAGERNGNLNYYRNISSGSSIRFELVTDSLGKVRTGQSTSPGYSAPDINDFDEDGKWDLLLGSLDNDLVFYSNIEDQLTGTFVLSPRLISDHIGLRVIPNSGDLNGDKKPEIIAGNFRGGVQIYSTGLPLKSNYNTTALHTVTLFPNPTSGKVRLVFPNGSIPPVGSVYITDIIGRMVPAAFSLREAEIDINLEGNPAGIYFIILKNSEESFTVRVVKK